MYFFFFFFHYKTSNQISKIITLIKFLLCIQIYIFPDDASSNFDLFICFHLSVL